MTRIRVEQPAGREDAVLPHGPRPRMAAAMEQLAEAVYQETTLSFREAEGARVRIAHINGCLMCQSYRVARDLPKALQQMNSTETANVRAARGAAPDDAFYDAAATDWRGARIFSPRERLAIEYAERIACDPSPLPYDDAFWSELHVHFDDEEIADLTYSIATWIATGRVVHALGLDGACAVTPAASSAMPAAQLGSRRVL